MVIEQTNQENALRYLFPIAEGAYHYAQRRSEPCHSEPDYGSVAFPGAEDRIKISSFTLTARAVGFFRSDDLLLHTSRPTFRRSAWNGREHRCFLLAAEQRKRFILPNAEVMIHQPSGGAQGRATDITIAAEHILSLRSPEYDSGRAYGSLFEVIEQDTERDRWLAAQEAVDWHRRLHYGEASIVWRTVIEGWQQ